MKDKDTPLRLVRKFGKTIHNNTYEIIGTLESNNIPGLNDPDFSNLPLHSKLAVLLMMGGNDSLTACFMALALTTCYMWRKHKVIYSFDEALAHLLATQADDFKESDILPANLLIHTPYMCTFIKTNVIEHVGGFWYWVYYDADTNIAELCIQFVTEDMNEMSIIPLNLLPGQTIQECCDDTLAEITKYAPPHSIESPLHYSEQAFHNLLVALQFILYIASENADIQDVPQNEGTRTKKKTDRILDKASEVEEKSVGVRIGNAIRKNRSFRHSSPRGNTGLTVRPHSRRGHWHHYWVGPRRGKRSLILKWIAPTFIHRDAFQPETVVIFPVKQ